MFFRKFLYRTFRAMGVKVERFRDPFIEFCALAGQDVDRIIDGGAYKGTFSQNFLRMFPKAEVHAFESQPDLYADLVTKSDKVTGWHVHNLALSDSEGSAIFHVPDAAFTGSLLQPGESFGPAREIRVTTTTLDTWSGTYGAATLLKLDLQGAELQALKGATHMLGDVRLILCEVNFIQRYENCALFHEVAGFLADHGFLLHRLYDIRSLSSGAWEMGDAIFVKR